MDDPDAAVHVAVVVNVFVDDVALIGNVGIFLLLLLFFLLGLFLRLLLLSMPPPP